MKGAAMPTVIAHHEVKDTDHWLASPKREEFFGPLGVAVMAAVQTERGSGSDGA
jgi:hypothetical protein